MKIAHVCCAFALVGLLPLPNAAAQSPTENAAPQTQPQISWPGDAKTTERATQLKERDRAKIRAEYAEARQDFAEAIKALETAAQIERSTFGESSTEAVESLAWLGRLRVSAGDYPAAVEVQREVLAMQARRWSDGNWRVKDAQRAIELTAQIERLSEADRKFLLEADQWTMKSNVAVSGFDWPVAISYAQRALDLRVSVFGPEHQLSVAALSLLENARFGTADYDWAMPLAQRLVDVSRSLLGEQHPTYIGRLGTLAYLHEMTERFDLAEAHDRKCVDLGRQTFEPGDAAHVGNMQALARVYERRAVQDQPDRAAAAVATRREVLEIRAKHSGEAHWQTVDARFDLVRAERIAALDAKARSRLDEAHRQDRKVDALRKQRQYSEGLKLSAAALQTRQELLGERLPERCHALTAMAWLYVDQDDFINAELLFRDALQLYQETVGNAHPHYAVALDNLGWLRRRARDDAAAEPRMREALVAFSKTGDQGDLSHAWCLHQLADLLNAKSKFEEAIPLARQALAIRQKNQSTSHPNTIASLELLIKALNASALQFTNRGELADGIARRRESAELTADYYGAADWRAIDARLDLAHAERFARMPAEQRLRLDDAAKLQWQASNCGDRGDFQEALVAGQLALQIRAKLLGEEHPHTLTSMNNVGWFHRELGNYALAEQALQRTIELRNKVLGPAHPHTAMSLNVLGWQYASRSQVAQAETCFRDALKIYQQAAGQEQNHGMTLTNLGSILLSRGKLDEAGRYLNEGLEVRRRAVGDKHVDYAISLTAVARWRQVRQEWGQAETRFQQSLEIFRNSLGEKHFRYVNTVRELSRLYAAMGQPDKSRLLIQSIGENPINTANPPADSIDGETDSAALRPFKQQVQLVLQNGHREEVKTIALSPDGRYAATGGNQVLLWEVASGRQVRELPGSFKHHVQFTPDSARLLVMEAYREIESSLWQVETGIRVQTFPKIVVAVDEFSVSPDASRIAVLDTRGAVHLYELATGKELRTWPAQPAGIKAICLSGDGRQLALGSEDGQIQLWDFDRDEPTQVFSDYTEEITSVALSPNAKYLLAAFKVEFASAVRLLDTSTGEVLWTSQSESITNTLFSADGTRVAAVARQVHVWNTLSGQVCGRAWVDGYRPAIAISVDNRRLLASYSTYSSASRYGVRLYDIASGKSLRNFASDSQDFTSFAFSEDGQRILFGRGDETLRLFDLRDGQEKQRFGPVKPAAVRFAAEENLILTGDESDFAAVWSVSSGAPVRKLSHSPEERYSHLKDLALSPDGRQLLTSNSDVARLRDLESGKLLHEFRVGHGSVTSAVFGRDETQVFLGYESGCVARWSMAAKEPLAVWNFAAQAARVVDCSADGNRLLITAGGTARLWDVPNQRELRLFDQVTVFGCVAFDRVGTRFLTGGGDGLAKLWDLKSGKLLHTLRGHRSAVTMVQFSSDGELLLTGSSDGTSRVWNARQGLSLRTLAGHSSELGLAAFTPDGKSVLTVNDKHLNRLWSVANGEILSEWSGGTHDASSVAFSADSRTAAALNSLGAVLIDVHSGQELKKLERPSGFYFQGRSGVVLTSDGQRLIASFAGGNVVAWDVKSGKILWTTAPGQSVVDCLALSANEQQVFATDKDAAIHCLDLKTGQEIRVYRDHTGPIIAVSASSDGKSLLSGNAEGEVCKWDLASGEVVHRWRPAHAGVVAAAMSADGRGVLTAGADQTARLWNAETGESLHALPMSGARLTHVALTPDCQWAIIATDKDVALWNVSNEKQERILSRTGIRSLALAPGGRQVLLDTQLLSIPAGEEVLKFGDPKSARIEAAGFARSGQTVAIVDGNFKFRDERTSIWDVQTGKQLQAFDSDANVVALSPNGATLLSSVWNGSKTWDVTSGKESGELSFPDINAAEFSGDGKRVLLECGGSSIKNRSEPFVIAYDAQSGVEETRITGRVRFASGRFVSSSDNRFSLFTGSDQRIVLLYKSEKWEEVCRFVATTDGIVTITPDNYYIAPRGALRQLGWRVGDKTFPFAHLDLRFNRPDIVLARLGAAGPEVIAAHRAAYEKRLKRMGLNEQMLGDDLDFPTVSITRPVELAMSDRRLTLPVKLHDGGHYLDRLVVTVNGVPIAGRNGISLRDKRVKSWQQDVEIELCRGRNIIQASVVNENGVESLPETREVEFVAPQVKPDVYILAVGVSQYQNSRYNLTYADKDARDLASFFTQRADQFGTVHVETVLNGQATRDAILSRSQMLRKSSVDDLVIVFLAGHGLLDDQLDYYFGTTDIDFFNPSQRGLSYEAIELLLDEAPARRKLLLMDTCHAGELDKDGVQLVKSFAEPEGKVVVRGLQFLPLERKAPSRLLEELFVDLRRGSGAVVIASAGGTESAFESDSWRNGVFTFALLEALQTRKADKDQDGFVEVSELRDYVADKVRRLTRGQQAPTTRRENLDFDFTLQDLRNLKPE